MFTNNIFIMDSEVLIHDWLFVFKEVATGDYTVIYNDNDAVIQFMERHPLLCGYNNKHYDNWILKGILLGWTPEQIKGLNDYIISGGNGWDVHEFREYRFNFDSFDLMDDTQVGTSLKSIEAHTYMNIVESSIDFNVDHKLSDEEMAELIRYCKYDVDATEKLFHMRQGYLRTKVVLGQAKGVAPEKALGYTNAKLTSIYLDAIKPDVMYTDERAYHYPDKLLRQYIPREVFDFFDAMTDPKIDRDDLFTRKLEIEVGGCPCTIAYGGIHAAIPTYMEEATETRSIRNKDVASYYPHLMTISLDKGSKYGFVSRSIPDPEIFIRTLEDRVQAKRSGDKEKNLALKLILNTTYGCMGNGKYDNGKYIAYNDLYDPLMYRSVCITGQLFLLELTMHLLAECPSMKIIQLNTDGIMVSMDNSDEPKWQEITQEWQDRTGFELEEDRIKKIIQKDVNNYIEIPMEGKPKIKGGMLVRGIAEAGAFKVNNDARCVAKALVAYFVEGITPEEYIAADDEIFDYQLIAKASHKYREVFQFLYPTEKHGEYICIVGEGVPESKQMCNRVYATSNVHYGTLYKVHGETGMVSKMPGLPDHCLIDNANELTIDAIDKDWYIRLAWSQIHDFEGWIPPKKNTRRINASKKKCLNLLSKGD